MTPHVHKELFKTICYEEIGSGCSRVVYNSRVLKDSVIKIEKDGGAFQNTFEWQVWQELQYTKHAKWFAPCEWISPCGTVLIMAKTSLAHKFPDSIPAFLADFKKANYGMLGGKFVCHDYGTFSCRLMKVGLTKRMIKVKEWW